MNKNTIIKSILAGVAVSFGAGTYLSLEGGLVGAFLFSIGLVAIYAFEWNLFTGKACFVVTSPPSYGWLVLTAFLGNFVGTFIMAWLFRFAEVPFIDYAKKAVEGKLDHSYISSFIMAIFCGMLLYVAVAGYKKQKDDFGRTMIIALPVMVFIIIKAEHVVANMFYISLTNMWDMDTLIFTLIVGVGNLIGCNMFPFIMKFIKD